MKTKQLFGILLFLCSIGFVSCGDDDDNKDPEGSVMLNMMNEGNGKTLLGASDVYINNSNNFKTSTCYIADVGATSGLGAPVKLSLDNLAKEIAVVPGHLYHIYGDGKYYSHDLMLEKALNFIDENAQKPFFLYFSPTIPHADLDIMGEVMTEYEGEFCETPFGGSKDGYKSQQTPRAAYAAMVTYLDKSVGLIIKELKEKGLYDHTIIVFTSDNGVHSEGGHDPSYFDSNGPFRGQKRDLYEGGIRTPFVIQWPGVIPQGVVTNHISAFWDFLPTIGELVQADIPQNIDGISYLPTLTGKGIQKEHDCIYYEFFEFGGKQSIMTPDGWKLVRLEVSDPSKTYEELYNIYTDPAETANVIKQYPAVARKLKNMIGGQRVKNARFHF